MFDERPRAAGRRQPEHIDVVLERDRDAVQRTAHAPGRALGVELPCLGHDASGSARASIEAPDRGDRESRAASGTRATMSSDVVSPRVSASCNLRRGLLDDGEGDGRRARPNRQLTICARCLA